MARPIRIWGRTTSSNVKKVLWLADELKLTYERIGADMKFGEIDTPAYRALNPNARVPTIQDGDFVLWESNSIMRYLGHEIRRRGLLSAPIRPRAPSIDRWLDWQLSTVIPVDVPVFWGTIRTPPEKRDKAAIAKERREARRGLENPRCAAREAATIARAINSRSPISRSASWPTAIFANPFIQHPDLPRLAAWMERLAPAAAVQEMGGRAAGIVAGQSLGRYFPRRNPEPWPKPRS